MTSRRLALIIAGLAPVCLMLISEGPAQIPEKYTNLKILPKEISRPELVKLMRGYATSLGARCHHCHVGEEGMPLSEFDFASDSKPQKRIARSMMRMVREINEKHIEPLETDRADKVEVTCRTCHHGQAIPRPLTDHLAEAFEDGGSSALLARYDDLYERFHGRDSFDFGEWALDGLAMTMTSEGNGKEALTLIERHAQLHPGSSHLEALQGEIRFKLGDRPKAIEHFEKAVELDPKNKFLKRQLEQLKGAS